MHISRGTAVIARPGVGVQFNTMPHNAVVIPLPEHVSTGQVLTILATARMPVNRTELIKSLGYTGLGEEVAADMIDELLHAGMLREYSQMNPALPVLRSGSASDRLVAALHKEGVASSQIPGIRVLQDSCTPNTVALLPGNLFLPSDLHYVLMQSSINHLSSAAVDGGAIVGPLVVPGITPCLNCIDYQTTTADPQWPSIRTQATGRPGTADPLHVEAAALITAGVVAKHLVPWQRAGCPVDDIPPLLLERVEYRLSDGIVRHHPVSPAAECPTCRLGAKTPSASTPTPPPAAPSTARGVMPSSA